MAHSNAQRFCSSSFEFRLYIEPLRYAQVYRRFLLYIWIWSKEAVNLECYWRVSGQSGESLHFALRWLGNFKTLSWETDLCACNNEVDPSSSRDLYTIAYNPVPTRLWPHQFTRTWCLLYPDHIAPQASITVVNRNFSPLTWRKYQACYRVCWSWPCARMHWCLVTLGKSNYN